MTLPTPAPGSQLTSSQPPGYPQAKTPTGAGLPFRPYQKAKQRRLTPRGGAWFRQQLEKQNVQ